MSEALIRESYDYMFAVAKEALERSHSYAPFASGVRQSGERIHLGLDLTDQPPDAGDHIAHLVSALRQDAAANALHAAGLAFDGQIKLEGGDVAPAICMHIEIKGGECLEAFVPYVREPDGFVRFYDPIFAPSDHEVFRP